MRSRRAIVLISTLLFWLLPVTAAFSAAEVARTVQTVPGMPPVLDPRNVYSETRPNNLSAAEATPPRAKPYLLKLGQPILVQSGRTPRSVSSDRARSLARSAVRRGGRAAWDEAGL